MPELFRTFDADGQPVALVPRNEVHKRGLWHRSVQVFVYNSASELLLQQRAADKDLYPLHWDTSVGEHLLPDEAPLAGAQRGLMEELGITGVDLTQLGGDFRVEHRGDQFCDREIQTGFRCVYDGPLNPNEEVMALEWVSLSQLKKVLRDDERCFAPWFHTHVAHYSLLNAPS